FFAAWPGVIKPGTEADAVALTMDLYATLCEVAGVEVRHEIDGLSVMGVLTGKTAALKERDLVWMRREGGLNYGGQCYYAIRRGAWKLLQNTPYSPLELYNLEADPGEETDLLDDERKVANELSAALRRHIQKAGAIPWQQPGR
ncbi:MAG TPA: N-acetylgalactosamine 6-sulfate sulfatase, partial [Verrucomicrobiales bacterium]|nr:N-acetylgalactosamine 6-sulfate sulfatase [Verrucomicrobiales bacterium]